MVDENILKCIVCGEDIVLSDDVKYCSHVAFIYGLMSADDDFWIYADSRFANQYIEQLLNNQNALEEEDIPIPDERQIKMFSQCLFSPIDNVSISMPFFKAWAEKCSEFPIKILQLELGYYSGVIIGFYI